MGMWKERSMTYKIGFAGVNLATLLFIVSFCAPSWALFRIQPSAVSGAHHHTQSLGLWQVCTEDLSLCKLALHSDNPGWLKAVRALECIAMFFAVASCFVGLYSNCILKAQLTVNIFNKNMETSAIVSVAFSSFGLIMFASQVRSYYTRYSDDAGHVWWGFVLACVSSALLLLSSALMLLAHRLRLLAELRGRGSASGQFAHRQFSNSSFHTNVRLPEYAESGHDVFIPGGGGGSGGGGGGPPPYEVVVGGDQGEGSEPPPPPYSQVALDQTVPPGDSFYVPALPSDESAAPALQSNESALAVSGPLATGTSGQ